MINLLPPIQKQELKNEKLRQKIILILFLILADLLLLMAIIFGLYAYISKIDSNLNKEISEKEKLLQSNQSKETKKIIESVNQNLSKINSIKNEQVWATDVLEKLNGLVPNTIYLKSFSFQNSTRDVENQETKITTREFFGRISLSGLANSRDTAVSFKKSLSQEPSFQEVSFDLAYLLKAINADFMAEFNFVSTKK